MLKNDELDRRFHTKDRFERSNADFKKIPGNPVVYWASDKIYDAFEYSDGFVPVGMIGTSRKGMATGDNERFVRYWGEVNFGETPLGEADAPKWFPYNNGGEYRKWYGNIDRLIDWENDGYPIRNFKDSDGRLRSRPQGLDQKFREMISWTSLSSTSLGVRFYPRGFISDQNGNFLVAEDRESLRFVLAFMCSYLAGILIKMLNPTMHILVRNVHDLPLQGKISARIEQLSGDISAATSTAHSKKLERERGNPIKQQSELQAFDEKLRTTPISGSASIWMTG